VWERNFLQKKFKRQRRLGGIRHRFERKREGVRGRGREKEKERGSERERARERERERE